MTIAANLWRNRDELLQAFHNAAIIGILKTWRRCEYLGTTPQEPDFVAGLVVESTPLIYSALHLILSPLRVSVSLSAVFCHQKPEVTFCSPKSASCELGDILFAYIHTPKDGPDIRNALLFQAKASAYQPYRIQSGENNQLHLYMNWPDFEYTRSSFLTGQKRFVTPKAPHSGAQYLLIDDRPPDEPMSGLLGFWGTYPVGCCMPDKFLYDHSHLASELFNLFTFRTGRPFVDKNTATKKLGWSQVVWDLLEIGIKKSFNRKNSGRHCMPRMAMSSVELLDGMSFDKASSRASCSTVLDIIGRSRIRSFYGPNNDIPPLDGDRESKTDEPGGEYR